jgi:hypothetical protein
LPLQNFCESDEQGPLSTEASIGAESVVPESAEPESVTLESVIPESTAESVAPESTTLESTAISSRASKELSAELSATELSAAELSAESAAVSGIEESTEASSIGELAVSKLSPEQPKNRDAPIPARRNLDRILNLTIGFKE